MGFRGHVYRENSAVKYTHKKTEQHTKNRKLKESYKKTSGDKIMCFKDSNFQFSSTKSNPSIPPIPSTYVHQLLPTLSFQNALQSTAVPDRGTRQGYTRQG